MALSIGVSVGSQIEVGGHVLEVQELVPPNVIVITVDRGDKILVSDSKKVSILPRVEVQCGTGGNRLAFHAPKDIRISRLGVRDGDQ